MPIARMNGIKIYYELHGQGYPLVVINGLAADISEFELITKTLAQHHRVLVFDNRGAGRSDQPAGPYTIQQMATDTKLLMRSLRINKAAVMGISMGSRIALELSLSNPELVSRLILVSGSARVQKSWRRTFVMTFLSRLPVAKSKYPQTRAAFEAQRRASANYDATPWLKLITMPTLILHGQSDRMASLFQARELKAGIKGSSLKLFPGGHRFYMTKSRRGFLQTVSRFVAVKSKRQTSPR